MKPYRQLSTILYKIETLKLLENKLKISTKLKQMSTRIN